MRHDLAHKLAITASKVADRLSNPNRPKNLAMKETFKVEEIVPLSEYTAAVVYLKSPTLKRVAVFFYFKETGENPQWWNFVPKDSHIIGMKSFEKIKAKVEKLNFERNFDQQKEE